MHFLAETTSNGVVERRFHLNDVPGVSWSPAGDGAGPLVLLAHGGGQHKLAPGLVSRAHSFVTRTGFAVVAIDAPGHGDRPKTEDDVRFANGLRERIAAGESVGPHIAQYNTALAARAVPEWRAVLDALPHVDRRRVGFWGVSMGTAIGVPLLAVEPRIGAAVLGLAGHDALAEVAAHVTVPLQFLLQWDDELVPRDSGLALFDAFGSREKTLHANPGRHIELPPFESHDSASFLARHLREPG